MTFKTVLSLFDGMSCGQIALQRAGISADKYYASEIDKHAIKVTQHNFPNTIQLGDVTQIKGESFRDVDLIMGGSPCQGFSFSGKQLNFDDPRSKLFFEFVRLIKECKPKYFLLENVKMKKDYEQVISEHLGVEPVEINSSLVSAQNRKRLYWANFPIEQPKDKEIRLVDILEKDVDGSFFLSLENIKKNGIEKYVHQNQVKEVVFTERRTEEAKRIRREYQKKYGKDFSPRRAKELVHRTDEKCNCLTTSLTKEHILLDGNFKLRKITPVECERLQTIPDNYTKIKEIANSQRYKMIGNGWTVDVIAHIFEEMKKQN